VFYLLVSKRTRDGEREKLDEMISLVTLHDKFYVPYKKFSSHPVHFGCKIITEQHTTLSLFYIIGFHLVLNLISLDYKCNS